jgi:uncharacterized cupin superfamily protein
MREAGMGFATNVWTELEDIDDGVRGTRLERVPGETLAAAVWELAPGASTRYHLHHGTKELIVVLRGKLIVRTLDGERELAEGDVLGFARGLPGAHGMLNRSEEPVRYLMVAEHWSLDTIEYPDEGTLCTIATTPSQTGDALFTFFRLEDGFDRD